MNTRPGLVPQIVGTLAAIVGAMLILGKYQYPTPGDDVKLFFGALLVIAGLLLRIEGAISARRNVDR